MPACGPPRKRLPSPNHGGERVRLDGENKERMLRLRHGTAYPYVPRDGDASNPTPTYDSFLPWPCSSLPFPPPPTHHNGKTTPGKGQRQRQRGPFRQSPLSRLLSCLLARTAHRTTIYPSSSLCSLPWRRVPLREQEPASCIRYGTVRCGHHLAWPPSVEF